MNLRKISCSKYSDLDDMVINKATDLGLPLIGGTALEVWANHYGTPGVRKRSDNDLDFISSDGEVNQEFSNWVKENIPSDKVKVDIHFVQSHDFTNYIRSVDGTLIMAPEYLLWSKLTRSDRSNKDIKDIQWILSISQLTDEEINNALDDLGVTENEFELLNSLF